MADGSSYVVAYRRKREGKTNYKRRLNLLKSGKLRLVVRPTNKHTRVQLVEYTPEGDKVVAQAHSSALKNYGWNTSTSNVPAAYLTGLLCAVKAGNSQAVLDIGLNSSIKGSRIYASVKGVLEGGVEVSCSQDILPDDERTKGAHIKGDVSSQFEAVKSKILESKK